MWTQLRRAAGNLETRESKRSICLPKDRGFFAASPDNYKARYYVYNWFVDYRFIALLTINKHTTIHVTLFQINVVSPLLGPRVLVETSKVWTNVCEILMKRVEIKDNSVGETLAVVLIFKQNNCSKSDICSRRKCFPPRWFQISQSQYIKRYFRQQTWSK